MKEDLIKRVGLAKNDKSELECLILDYLPFIKKKMLETTSEDMLTIGMLAFSNSIQQYDNSKGSFLSFAALTIRCRLLDELRKENRYFSKVIPIHADPSSEYAVSNAELEISLKEYDRESERKILADEIKLLSAELLHYDITFAELTKICPKQMKSRLMCISMAKEVLEQDTMRTAVIEHHRLPQGKLAEQFSVSVKTIEKHRKYIVTLVLLLHGDYPNIKTFIPAYREVII